MSPAALLLVLWLQPQSEPKAVPAKPPAEAKPNAGPPEEVPPEEDQQAAPKEYSFNPIQAAREMRVGEYYMKRAKYRAAAERFREASKWNAMLAEAYRRLGEAEEKQEDMKAAREAYQHYLEMNPDAKTAAEVRKHLEKLPTGT